MDEQAGPSDERRERAGPGAIAFLIEEERAMLREFAETLRGHDVRNPVAREALDRAAEQLERVAADRQDDAPPDSPQR